MTEGSYGNKKNTSVLIIIIAALTLALVFVNIYSSLLKIFPGFIRP